MHVGKAKCIVGCILLDCFFTALRLSYPLSLRVDGKKVSKVVFQTVTMADDLSERSGTEDIEYSLYFETDNNNQSGDSDPDLDVTSGH